MRRLCLLALVAVLSCAPARDSVPMSAVAWSPSQAAISAVLSAVSGSPFGSSGSNGRAQTFYVGNTTANGDGIVLASTVKICWTATGAGPCGAGSYFSINTGTGIMGLAGAFNASSTLSTDSNTISANSLKVAVVHGSGTAAQAIESGTQALTAGAAAPTFGTAFGAAPVCTCTDTTATAAVKCSTSTSTLTIAGTGTDTIAWICIGQR